MFYLLHGGNVGKRRESLDGLVSGFLKENPETTITKLNKENLSSHSLDELVGGQSLFEKSSIVIFYDLFGPTDTRDEMLSRAKDFASSKNIFIAYESELPKIVLEKLKKVSEKSEEFILETKERGNSFNVFALSDEIGKRDKKRAWVNLVRAFEAGLLPEEVHGTVFWQVKSMLLTKSPEASISGTGLKPFVFSKASLYSKNYSKEELEKFSSNLVSLYHDSHRGMRDFSFGLEKLILETL